MPLLKTMTNNNAVAMMQLQPVEPSAALSLHLQTNNQQNNNADASQADSHSHVSARLKKIATIFAGTKKDKKDKKKSKKNKKSKKSKGKTVGDSHPPKTSAFKGLTQYKQNSTSDADAKDDNSLPFPTSAQVEAAVANNTTARVLESHYYEHSAVDEEDDPTEEEETTTEEEVAEEKSASVATPPEGPPTKAQKAAAMVEASKATLVEESVARMVDGMPPILPPSEKADVSTGSVTSGSIKKNKRSKSSRKKRQQQQKAAASSSRGYISRDDMEMGDEIEQLFVCCQEEVMHLVGMIPDCLTFMTAKATSMTAKAKDLPCDPSKAKNVCVGVVTTTVMGVGAVVGLAGGVCTNRDMAHDDDVSVLTEERFTVDADDEQHLVVVASKSSGVEKSAAGKEAPVAVEEFVDAAFAKDGMAVLEDEGGVAVPQEESVEGEVDVPVEESPPEESRDTNPEAPVHTAEDDATVTDATVTEDDATEDDADASEPSLLPSNDNKEDGQLVLKISETLMSGLTGAEQTAEETPPLTKTESKGWLAEAVAAVAAAVTSVNSGENPAEGGQNSKPSPSNDLKKDGELVLKTSETLMSGLTGAEQTEAAEETPAVDERVDRSVRKTAKKERKSPRQKNDIRDEDFLFEREDRTVVTFKSARTMNTFTSFHTRKEGQRAETERLRTRRRHKKNSNTRPGGDEIEKARLERQLSMDSGAGIAKGNDYPLLDDPDDVRAIRSAASETSVNLSDMINDALQRADRTLSLAHKTAAE